MNAPINSVQAALDRQAAERRKKNAERQAKHRATTIGYQAKHAADMAQRRATKKASRQEALP